jgi:hypothetical protein
MLPIAALVLNYPLAEEEVKVSERKKLFVAEKGINRV